MTIWHWRLSSISADSLVLAWSTPLLVWIYVWSLKEGVGFLVNTSSAHALGPHQVFKSSWHGCIGWGVFSPFYPVIIKTSLSQCVHPDIRVQLTFIALFSYLLLEPLWILKIFDFSNYLHLENDHSLKWGKYFCRLICTARKNASNGLLETQSQRNSAAKTFMNIAVVMFSEFYLGLYAPR